MTVKKLGKGVTLCCEKADGFKTSVISINMAMPLERTQSSLAARALLPFLLHRTNSVCPTVSELNRRLAKLYGAVLYPSVSKSGESQLLKLTVIALDDRFALDGESISRECVQLLCDCLFKPVLDGKSFPADDVEREKRLLIERIESENDDKRVFALKRCEEEMCRDEAYGKSCYGTVEEIEALTGADVFAAWIDLLLHSCMQINVVGAVDEAAVENTVKPLIDAIVREDICELKTEYITSAEESRFVEQAQELNQSKLVMGYRAGMTYDLDNFAAIFVMNDILGSGTYSKLFTNVREKQSLCYYCSSRLVRGKGIIFIQSGVETENAQKAIDSIRHEIDDMRAGNFTDEVLEFSKLSIRDSLMSVYDSPEGINTWYANQMGLANVLAPKEIAEMADAVSREEVILAACEITEDTVFLLKATGTQEEE